jgi:hypothetical protein
MPTFMRTQSIEHRIGASGRLAIRVTSSDTRIRAVDGETARVRGTYQIGAASEADADRIYQELQLRITASDGSLDVEEPKSLAGALGGALARLFGGEGHPMLELDDELPPGADLRFEGVSADVQANGLRGQQRYQTVSGDLLLQEAGGSLRMEAVSGDITIRADAPVALQTNAVSGDLSVMSPRLASLRAISVSGDVELEGAFAADGDHRIETVSGDVAIGLVGGATFDVRGLSTDVSCRLPNEMQGHGDQRRVVVGDGAARIRFSSMSGDLSIAGPRRMTATSPTEAPPQRDAQTAAGASDQLEILRALERGEIDVDEATRRLTGANGGE